MSLRLAAATAALVLATSTLASAASGPVKFTLHPQNHSGEVGNVTMTQDGDNVVVVVTTENAPRTRLNRSTSTTAPATSSTPNRPIR